MVLGLKAGSFLRRPEHLPTVTSKIFFISGVFWMVFEVWSEKLVLLATLVFSCIHFRASFKLYLILVL